MRPQHLKNSKGLDVPIDGAPSAIIERGAEVDAVALVGADYVGLEPKLLVAEGDRVNLGQPLFAQKRDPAVRFVSPANGTVAKINRGERRALKSVVVELDASNNDDVVSKALGSNVSESDLRACLLENGFWPAFRTRPFSRIPASDAVPRSIFVTAIDTRPLAGDPGLVVAENEEAFSEGLHQLAKLASEHVYLCTSAKWNGPVGSDHKIKHCVFEGPHPSGLPGTHIHHLDPVGSVPSVWHVGYQDVIAIGKLIGEGRIWTDRIVALGGAGFANPRMVRTRLGADLRSLTASELTVLSPDNVPARLISGCVLSGRSARGAEAFLGRYHLQVSAIPQMRARRWRPWNKPRRNRFSFAELMWRFRSANDFTTDQCGRATAMIPVDTFERLIPMDVLAAPLLKSLLIQHTDQAQALGALELDEEDLALCSFVCPGKNDYGAVLRRNLEIIERDG